MHGGRGDLSALSPLVIDLSDGTDRYGIYGYSRNDIISSHPRGYLYTQCTVGPLRSNLFPKNTNSSPQNTLATDNINGPRACEFTSIAINHVVMNRRRRYLKLFCGGDEVGGILSIVQLVYEAWTRFAEMEVAESQNGHFVLIRWKCATVEDDLGCVSFNDEWNIFAAYT
jgi:hypothetical protein